MEPKSRPPWDIIVIAVILLIVGSVYYISNRNPDNSSTASAVIPTTTTVSPVTTTTAGQTGVALPTTTTTTTVAVKPKTGNTTTTIIPTTTTVNGTPCADGSISTSVGQGSCSHHGGETTTTTQPVVIKPPTTTTTTSTTVPKPTTTTSTTSTSTTTTSTTSTTIPAPLPVLQVVGYDKNLQYTLVSKTLDGQQQLDEGHLNLTYICRATTLGVVYIQVVGAPFVPRTFGESLTCDGTSRVVDLVVSRKTSSPYTPPGRHVDTTMSLQFNIPGLIPGQKIPGLTTGPALPGLVTGQAIGTAPIGIDYVGWPGL